MSRRTVNLVATNEMINNYFPSTTVRKIDTAQFPINPTACKTALGTWLAEIISTTCYKSDAYKVRIILPKTEEGLRNQQFSKSISKFQEPLNTAQSEAMFSFIEKWIADRRLVQRDFHDRVYQYMSHYYHWPLFGASNSYEIVPTPEGYFDDCADSIRKTGGVIYWAGPSREIPPDSILNTMAVSFGGGAALTHAYESQLYFG